MLSIGAMSGGRVQYYVNLAREDYYLEGGEPPGQWLGLGAESLGLTGKVEAAELYNVYDGRSPDGSRTLVQATSKNRQPGWDLTFSAPKSVSVLWAIGSEEDRAKLAAAHWKAVQTAVGYIEENLCITRRGKGGAIKEQAGLVAAAFEHSTSRLQDPQLHTHVLILNASVRRDGTTGAILSKPCYNAKMALGALYRVELASELKRLGLQIIEKDSLIEVVGVPERVIRAFSKRREQIEESLSSIAHPSAADAARAAIETRQVKKETSRSEIFKQWREEALGNGFGEREAKALYVHARSPAEAKLSPKEVITEAILDLEGEKPAFTKEDLVEAAANRAVAHDVSGKQVQRATEEALKAPDVVRLEDKSPKPLFATSTMLESAKRCEELIRKIRASASARVKEAFAAAPPEVQPRAPLPRKRLLIRTQDYHTADGPRRISAEEIIGRNAEVWRKSGLDVRAVAIDKEQADEFQRKTGIEAESIRNFLGIYFSPAELRTRFSPDLLEPAKKAMERFGPDILAPFKAYLDAKEREARERSLLAPLEKLARQHGPDIRQLFRFAGEAMVRSLTNAVREKKPLTENSVVVVDRTNMGYPLYKEILEKADAAGAQIVEINTPALSRAVREKVNNLTGKEIIPKHRREPQPVGQVRPPLLRAR